MCPHTAMLLLQILAHTVSYSLLPQCVLIHRGVREMEQKGHLSAYSYKCARILLHVSAYCYICVLVMEGDKAGRPDAATN
jgi:hypothetical protein